MNHRHGFRILSAFTLGALLLLVAAPGVRASEARAPSVELGRDTIQRLRTSPHSDLVLPLPGGRSVALRVAPFNLFSRGAQITETDARGPRALHPDITFLKGDAGAEGTWAAFTVTARGVTGNVHFGNQDFNVAPGETRPDGSIAHSVQEAEVSALHCGNEDLAPTPVELSQRMLSPGTTSLAGVRLACDIAFDCDYELYTTFGADLGRATDFVLASVAAVSVIYERDLDVTIRVAYLNFWTTPDDPFTATGNLGRATEFRDWWTANRSAIPCNMAHLLTGILLGGYGFYDGICTHTGSGVSSMASSPSLDILAHEIGHNFGSRHTHSCFWQSIGLAPAGTLLDSCVTAEDGNCYAGPTGIIPPDGGTIMSYCRRFPLRFHTACITWMRGRAELCLPAADYGPVIDAPSYVEGVENSPLSFTVTAADPDLQPIESLVASQLPAGAVFTPDPTMTQGTLEWTPVCQQAGTYGITFTATSSTTGSRTTLVTILPTDCPPVVTAPASIQGREGELMLLEVSAMDREDPLFDFTATPLPAGASFTTSDDLTSGFLIWLPGYAQAGSYPLTFTASNGMQGAATTQIEILNTDRPPSVTAPKTASTIPGLLVQVHVTSTDPDAEPIGSLEASGLPPGASFTSGATGAGDLRWLPGPGQEGSYPVTFTATNALSASATTRVDVVASADHPPLVSAPSPVGGSEGVPLTVQVAVSDPEGNPITSLGAGPLPQGATFLAGAGNTSGTLSWSPDFDQAGSYEVTLSAVSASGTGPALTGTATVNLSIENVDRSPSVTAPADVDAAEGALVSIPVTAADPDGDPIESLAADIASLPVGNDAQFVAAGGNGTGTLTWTPTFADAGDYGITFTAMNALGGSAHTTIHVASTDRAPAASAGGPYQGFAGIPLGMDGGGSTDPDGDPLTYLWDFGDGTQGVGASPEHTYFASGDFPVSLSVTDGAMSGQDATTAHVAPVIEAGAYVTDPNKTIRLRSAKSTWCALVEPTTSSFDPVSVDAASLVLKYGGSQISATPGKEIVIGDWDRDGVSELPACFSKADLRTLFSGLPAGKQTLPVAIEGALLSGGRIRAPLQIDVVSDGTSLSAAITPNPLTQDATLTFATPRAGRVKVSLFDSQGRLVRRLLDESVLPAGYHDLRLNGADAGGGRLPSGVYFYRIETPQEASTGRFAITR